MQGGEDVVVGADRSLGRRCELAGLGNRGALFVRLAGPDRGGGQLGLAGQEGGGKVVLQLAKGDAQRRRELFGQLGHGIGLRRQCAAAGDGGDGVGTGFGFRLAGGEAVIVEQALPGGPALGDGLGYLLPRGELGGESVLLLVELEQLRIAAL